MKESQINSDTVNENQECSFKKQSDKNIISKSKNQYSHQLLKEIDNINMMTESNRDKVPLLRLIEPDDNEKESEDFLMDRNNNQFVYLNYNSQLKKSSNKELMKIVAVPTNEAHSAIIDETEILSIPFDLKAIKTLSNESYVDLPIKLENNKKLEEKNEQYDRRPHALLNYEYILLGCEQNKIDQKDTIAKDDKKLPLYVYFYTDPKTFLNIFEKRKIDLQPLFYKNKLVDGILLLNTPPNSSDHEILLNMFGSGVPLNTEMIKCYLQFKLDLLLNFRNSIIDLNNGKYLCLKTIQFGKKNPKHDFRNMIN